MAEHNSDISVHHEKKEILPPIETPESKVVTYATERMETEENKIIHESPKTDRTINDKIEVKSDKEDHLFLEQSSPWHPFL